MKASLFLLAAAAAVPAAAAETIAIRGATVVDTVGTKDVENATVLVRDGRIAAVGRNVRVPRGARIVDGRGKFLIPGLIDGHVHFFQSGGLYTRPDAIDLRSEVPYADEIAGIRSRLPDTFSRYGRAGVTGAVDMGGPFWNFEVRDLAARRPDAPRVWVAGPLLSPYQPAEIVTDDPAILKTESAAQAREQALAQIARRPDFLKFWYIVGPDGPAAARPLLTAMVAEGRRARVPAAVHAPELETARAAVAEGANVLVHSVDDKEVDDAFVEAVKKSGAVYIPTLTVMSGYADVYGRKNPLTPGEQSAGQPDVVRSFDKVAALKLPQWAPQASAQIGSTLPRMRHNLMRMYRAGVPIVMGTDAGNIGTLHAISVPAEMEAMEEAGMPARAVLASATIAAARMLGVERELGSVEPGKVADLVLLREDPRRDASAVAAVDLVLRKGVPIERPSAAEALVQRQLEAYNRWDADAFAATYSEDVELYELGLGKDEPFSSGRAKLREEYAGFFAKAKPRVDVVQRIVSGPFVVDHERGDFGGEKIEAAAIYMVEDGLIRKVWFADAAFKGGDSANAAAVVDRLRNARGKAAMALHSADHQLRFLGTPLAILGPLQPASGAPAARIVAGPFVIDHEAGRKPMLTVRLVRDGKVARTWVASR
jgi:imidazolonepropionase-like amidohydrolase